MNSLKKNLVYNCLYQLLAIFIPLITTPYLSRVLGSAGVGIYSYNFSIANYFVLFIMLGINNYGNREIAKAKDDKEKVSVTFWNIYAIQFALGVIINVLYLIYCTCIKNNSVVAFTMFFYVLSGMLDINWFFFGMEKFKLTVGRNTVIKLLSTISVFTFVKEPQDIWKYCLIMTGGMLISQIIMWFYLKKELYFIMPKWEKIRIHIAPNLFLFLTVLAVSLFKILDKIMLGIMTTDAQVGYYELSEKIILIPTSLIISLGTVTLPRVSNMIVKKQDGTSLLQKSIIVAMFFSSSFCFGIMAVSQEFVPLFYGDGYEVCVYLYLVLLPSCLFLAFANVIRMQYLLPHQMDKHYVVSAFIGAAVNIIINVALIPGYGAIGAAIGTFFAEASVCLYQSFAVSRYIPIMRYIKESAPFILAGITMFMIVFPLKFEGSGFYVLLAKIMIGGVSYFVLLVLFVLVQALVKKTKRM